MCQALASYVNPRLLRQKKGFGLQIVYHKVHSFRLFLGPDAKPHLQISRNDSVWGTSQQPFVPDALTHGLRIPRPTPSLTLLFLWLC